MFLPTRESTGFPARITRDAMGRAAGQCTIDVAENINGVRAMSQVNDLSYSPPPSNRIAR
jgi:hypothetical protein